MHTESCDILILSASYGGGHNQVARALTQALQNQVPGIKITTVDYCELLFPLFNRLTQFGYTQSIRHFPVGYALYYQATGKISPDSFWQKSLNRMGYTELIVLVNRLRPRVIISTFPLPAGVLSKMKSSGDLDVPIVTVITDISVHSQWIHPYTDLYLVGSAEVAAGLTERGIKANQIVVTGIPVLPEFNRRYNHLSIREELGLKPDTKLVLFMGGSEGIFGTTNFHHLLANIQTPVEAIVLTGSNYELYERLQAVNQHYPEIKVTRFIHNVASVMEIADVLVTKAGGLTISEALAKGLPMIIYKPSPGQEEANAAYLRKHRAALIIKGERRLRTVIQRMVDDEPFWNRLRKNCLKLGKPNSAEHCARLISKMLQSGNGSFGYNDRIRREMRVGNTPGIF
ncbi:MAG TPA: glycosyltransferase [Bacillota bacterium]|nr:glycosyltransferase [Bacillota bacterium]